MADFNHFPQAVAGLDLAIKQGIKKAAFDIQAQAASSAPVDTGNLRNSIYTHTSDGNNYPGGASTDVIDDQIPEVDELTAYVAAAVSYAIYVELGTIHAPAQPFMLPAANMVEGSLQQYFDAVEAAMKQAGV